MTGPFGMNLGKGTGDDAFRQGRQGQRPGLAKLRPDLFY